MRLCMILYHTPGGLSIDFSCSWAHCNKRCVPVEQGGWAEERAAGTMRDGEHAHLMRMARPVRSGSMRQVVTHVGDLLASIRRKRQGRLVPRQHDVGRCPAFQCQ